MIVTDNALIASAIGRGLRRCAPVEIIGYIGTGASAPADLADCSPDVVIVDDAIGRETAISRIADARRAAPSASIILLSTDMLDEDLARAAEAGVDAAVRRVPDAFRVGALVRDVLAGDVYHVFTRAPAAGTCSRDLGEIARLTARETEILQLVAAGSSNAMIARTLWVTEQTVKFHLSNVYRKLGVSNRTQASRYAHLHGLLDAADDKRALPAAA